LDGGWPSKLAFAGSNPAIPAIISGEKMTLKEINLKFYPPGTSPIDIAWELNREHLMNMLVWDGQRYHICTLWCGDSWDSETYSSKTMWPDGCGSEFAKHWQFAVL
jgi:hypothetical protein